MSDSWQVTGQRQTSLMQNGQFVEAMQVSFTTASGVSGHVTIPLQTYSQATVKEAIDKRVALIDPVSSLTGSSAVTSSLLPLSDGG